MRGATAAVPVHRLPDMARARLRLEALGETLRIGRDPVERRAFLGNPPRYLRDVFGLALTPQQERALELMEAADRVLIASAHNVGKTFLLGAYAVYYLDVVGAQPDVENGLEEGGARILLPGPDGKTIHATVYSEMLAHARRAEARGYQMPGARSELSVNWIVRPQWGVESFSPPAKAGQQVAHTASGRHHRNQIALIEEGQGVSERLWRSTEGMCSSAGNKIVSSFNPTEASGPTWQRARSGAYRVLHLSAFDHPNVRQRRSVVPAAVGFLVVDGRIAECQDRGPHPGTAQDPKFGDFLYALPPTLGATERGGRSDGIPGHPDGRVRVYRPTAAFEAQVKGEYPKNQDAGLFTPGRWDEAVDRWLRGHDPDEPPDRVGVDAAREGADDCCYAPAWGEDAPTLLQAWAEAQLSKNGELVAMTERRRVRVGEIRTAPKGDGPTVASAIRDAFPLSPWLVDEGGVGASVLDHARAVLGVEAEGVSFASTAPARLSGERYCENTRAALYERAAMLVERGLCDVPDDPALREEVLAHRLLHGTRSVEDEAGQRRLTSTIRVLSKDEIKRQIGRSPDRSDAFVLALWGATERYGVLLV